MKVQLKEITDQLTDVSGLPKNQKVAALIDDNSDGVVNGWTVVECDVNGNIHSIFDYSYPTINELLLEYNIRKINS